MKKILLSISVIASLFAADKVLPQDKVLQIVKKTPLYYRMKTKLSQDLKLQGVETKDFYVIKVYDKRGNGKFYVTKDFKYTILGNVLNNQTKRPVVANFPAMPFQGNKQIVKDGVVFTYGKGKEDLYIVTDPECPFCKRFEKMAKNSNLENKYKIHLIFLPLSFHKHSKAMIYYILSADNEAEKIKRFHDTLNGDNSWKNFKPTPAQKAKIDAEINKSLKAATELGARGTPSFFDKDMKEINSRNTLLK